MEPISSRNVYVVSTDLATGTPVFRWITSYDPCGTTWAGEPRLVKLSDSRFVLLFGVRTSTSETLDYRLLDASGAVLAQKSWANVSFDASSQPLVVGSRLYWAGFGMSPSAGSTENYYLYGLDLTDPTAPTLMTAPPPTVTALSPSLSSSSGGTAVTITGTDFGGVTGVTFGGTAATSFRVDSATQVTAIAPPHAAGTVAVQVNTLVDSSADTPADDFTYIATTRYQQSGTVITYLGDWSSVATWSASGGSLHSTSTAGAAVIVKFTGDSIWLVGKTAPWYGKALVSVDGGPEEYVDFYSTSEFYKRAVYTKAGLGAGTHTLVMRCTREKNLASSGYTISLDALDVTGSLTQAEAPQGYQQNDANFEYAGSWATSAPSTPHFRAAPSTSVDGPGSSVNVAFDRHLPAYLAWYAKKGRRLRQGQRGPRPRHRQERVTTVDLYSRYDAYKQKVYNTGLLSDGPHTLSIYWTGEKNAAAWGTKIDARRRSTSWARRPMPSRHRPSPGATSRTTRASPTWATGRSTAPLVGLGWQLDLHLAEWGGGCGQVHRDLGQALRAAPAPSYGQATFILDGVETTVDFHSATSVYKKLVYDEPVLSAGEHTLIIKCAEPTCYQPGCVRYHRLRDPGPALTAMQETDLSPPRDAPTKAPGPRAAPTGLARAARLTSASCDRGQGDRELHRNLPGLVRQDGALERASQSHARRSRGCGRCGPLQRRQPLQAEGLQHRAALRRAAHPGDRVDGHQELPLHRHRHQRGCVLHAGVYLVAVRPRTRCTVERLMRIHGLEGPA